MTTVQIVAAVFNGLFAGTLAWFIGHFWRRSMKWRRAYEDIRDSEQELRRTWLLCGARSGWRYHRAKPHESEEEAIAAIADEFEMLSAIQRVGGNEALRRMLVEGEDRK